MPFPFASRLAHFDRDLAVAPILIRPAILVIIGRGRFSILLFSLDLLLDLDLSGSHAADKLAGFFQCKVFRVTSLEWQR